MERKNNNLPKEREKNTNLLTERERERKNLLTERKNNLLIHRQKITY